MKKNQTQKAANIAKVGIMILWITGMLIVIKSHL
jgi:hypothetical protein